MYRIVLHNFIVFFVSTGSVILTGEVLIRDLVYSSNQIVYLKFNRVKTYWGCAELYQ
jgi:hypothetical protein